MSITINVNPFRKSSIDRAIKELESLKYVLKIMPDAYVDAICERFNEILESEAPEDAKGMWVFEKQDTENGKVGVFRFRGEVEFIEFGTGIVGKENHDGANMDWAERLPPPYTGYESGHYINLKTHEWRYRDGNKWIVTKGREADPFIYRSVQQVLSESGEIAMRVLGGNNGKG